MWHLITGEYPPQPGGVADYARLLACGLADAGDNVDVWTSECREQTQENAGVTAHRLPGRFGPRAMRHFTAQLRRAHRPYRVLVQYVPHLYGWRAVNVPFCLWLRHRCPVRPWVMFHEVAYPVCSGQSMRHNLLGGVTRVMAKTVARSAERVFIATPAWAPLLRRLAPDVAVEWLPVPSNIATTADVGDVKSIRNRYAPDASSLLIGHFGTYGTHIASILRPSLLALLKADARRVGLLVGRRSEEFARQLIDQHWDLRGRLHATGELAPERVAACLKACDMLLQPYGDGATSRRGSLMAGLALGMPIVTTRGHLSEPFWEDGMVAVSSTETHELVAAASQVLADPRRRQELGRRAAATYQQHFSIERTICTLRDDRQRAESPVRQSGSQARIGMTS